MPDKLTAMESDNDSTARRIVTWDRMPGFSHIHITKMFEVTVTTANVENTALYHTGIAIDCMATILYAQTPPTQETRPVVVMQYCKQ
jgi:hypothetical protein